MPRHLSNFPYVQDAHANVFTPTDPHGDIRTISRTNVIDLKPWNGVSTYRDITTTSASATITSNATTGEIQLQTAALVNSAATITSRDYVNFQTGTGLCTGIGIRMSTTTLAGTQVARWGMFDGTNGTYYQMDATGLSVVQLRDSVATSVARASWNIDRLDGTGPSGYTLDMTRGTCFLITYSLGGHGTLLFSAIVNDTTDASQITLPIHCVVPTSTNPTTMTNPCMPLRIELNNGASSAIVTTVSIGSRTANIMATNLRPMVRWSQAFKDASTAISNTAFTFVFGVRKEDAGRSIRCNMRALEMLCTNRTAIYQILLNPTLTGGTFTSPTYQTGSHTILETNINATGVSGGTVILSGTIPNNVHTRIPLSSDDDICLNTGDVWVLTARSQIGGGTLQVASMTFTEEW